MNIGGIGGVYVDDKQPQFNVGVCVCACVGVGVCVCDCVNVDAELYLFNVSVCSRFMQKSLLHYFQEVWQTKINGGATFVRPTQVPPTFVRPTFVPPDICPT